MNNPRKYIESGRSMVEILGALAIMGVLSIGGITGYTYGMAKWRANEYANQVRLAYAEIVTQPAVPTEGTPELLETIKIVGEDVYFYGEVLEAEGEDAEEEISLFLDTAGLDKRACKAFLDMKLPPIVEVYTGDKEVLTAELCEEEPNLLIEFRSTNPTQIVECRLECVNGDLDEGCLVCMCRSNWDGALCDECLNNWEGDDCEICPTKYQDRKACICSIAACAEYNEDCSCAQCQDDFPYELTQEENAEGTTCKPDKTGEKCGWSCDVPEGEWCNYSYVNETPSVIPDSCKYSYSNDVPSVLPDTCKYSYSNETPSVLPDSCSYTYVYGDTPTITVQKGCAKAGEYCHLRYKNAPDDDHPCSGTGVGDSGAAYIYGTCHPRTMFIPTCNMGSTTPTITVEKPCLNNEYCHLRYKEAPDDDHPCSGKGVGDSGADYIYGTCHPRTMFIPTCNMGSTTPAINPVIPCKVTDEYCHLRYKEAPDDEHPCSGKGVGDSGAAYIYGTCHPRTMFTPTCNMGSTTPTLTQNKGCPLKQYCHLRFRAQSCSAGVGDAGAEKIYGNCQEQTNFGNTCKK